MGPVLIFQTVSLGNRVNRGSGAAPIAGSASARSPYTLEVGDAKPGQPGDVVGFMRGDQARRGRKTSSSNPTPAIAETPASSRTSIPPELGKGPLVVDSLAVVASPVTASLMTPAAIGSPDSPDGSVS